MQREEGSGWGTRVYLWQIHVDIWQNQYNIVKLKNKMKKKTQRYLITLVTYHGPAPPNFCFFFWSHIFHFQPVNYVGIYQKETILIQKDSCILVFIVAFIYNCQGVKET